MQIFLNAFGSIPDPRASNARHDLGELLVIAFVSVLCGSSSCAEMAEFGRAKENVFRSFLAISRFVWVGCFPVMRGAHQMLWYRVRLAGG